MDLLTGMAVVFGVSSAGVFFALYTSDTTRLGLERAEKLENECERRCESFKRPYEEGRLLERIKEKLLFNIPFKRYGNKTTLDMYIDGLERRLQGTKRFSSSFC